MKQNQKKRFNNGRFNNRNNRQMLTRSTVFESSGPCGKLHGTPLQLFEKYQAGAKDALIQNDVILAQTCMQYADHYMRLQNQAIANEQACRKPFVQPVAEVVQDDSVGQENTDSQKVETVEEQVEEQVIVHEKVDEKETSAQSDLSVPVFPVEETPKKKRSTRKPKPKKED